MGLPQYIFDLPDTDEVRVAYKRGIERAIDWVLEEMHKGDAFYKPGLRKAVEAIREHKP